MKNMKKKILIQSLVGASIGLNISFLITVAISLTVGDGRYYPVVPALTSECGSEIKAVLLQTVLALLYGAVWGGVSIVWKIEKWSLLKQTMVHLLFTSIGTFPVAYVCYWMPRDRAGIIIYFSIFVGIYLFIWITQYMGIKRRIQEMNDKINER